MINNNSIDQEFKEKLTLIEKEMDNHKLDIDYLCNDQNVSSSFKMYLQEIGRYPLLTADEEKECGSIIRSQGSIKLLKIKEVENMTSYTLNKDLLFLSLVNGSIYSSVIDSILSLYSNINSHEKNVEEDLLKYKRLSNNLGRALNKEELKEYFNITDSIEVMNDISLLNDVKEYVKFKLAFNKLFVSNLRLVISVAKKYHCNIDLLELISEGNVGLLRAIPKYNPEYGYRFSTYAVYWITQSIDRAISKYNLMIRLPDHFYHDLKKFKRDVENLEKQEGRILTVDEISEKLGIPVEKINEFQSNMLESISLDGTIGEDKETSLINFMVNEDDVDRIVSSNSLKEDITKLFKYLTERELAVIKMRFGIGRSDDLEMNIADIAKELSISIGRVKQIELKALYKMKKMSNTRENKSLKYYLR